MEDIDSSPVSPNPRKRGAPESDTPEKKPLNLKGTQFIMPTPPDTDRSNNTSPSTSNPPVVREASPSGSISTLTSIDDVASAAGQNGQNSTAPAAPPATGSGPPPAKRRKLTPSEKIERLREKEIKEREKAAQKAEKEAKAAEDKARKEEEKAKRDEEKRIKDMEKQKKAEKTEAKKREKELEEERKLQEKTKKERAQMRLGAFFQQKPTTPAKAGDGSDGGSAFARRKSLSLEPFDSMADQIRRSASPLKGVELAVKQEPTPSKPIISDYHKYFLPFEPPSNSTVAPTYTISNPHDLAYWQGEFDNNIRKPECDEKFDIGVVKSSSILDHHFVTEENPQRGAPIPNMRELIDRIQGTSHQPIDLTKEPERRPIEALQAVSRRLLHFYEDVRPAYFGTYTKIVSPSTSRKISRNPFSRSRTDTEYDYDSEAEWDEPEEGEDLMDDDDDDAESTGEKDEMDEFLDDEDDALKNKRKLITGDLEATTTGLCWEAPNGNTIMDLEAESTPMDMEDMRIGVLFPDFVGKSIDPFSTSYWQGDMAPPAVPLADSTVKRTPGRPPLQDRINGSGAVSSPVLIGAAAGQKGPITSVAATQGSKRGPKPSPKVLSTEDLAEFKEAVVGSPLGKLELQKGLKTRFPKITNETIKETLGSMFAQKGNTKADKSWVYVGDA